MDDSHLHPGGRRLLPGKLGRGVQPASQNAYPIYDQNLWFPYPIYNLTKNLIPYLWPDS